MQEIRLIKPLTLFCLLAFATSGFAQTWPGSSATSTEEVAPQIMTAQDRALLNQNSLDQAPVGADECDLRFPYPPIAAKKDPYAENGPEICKSLQIRGQRMQCEIDALVGDRSGGPTTTGAKIELASWARCNSKVAAMLVAGYYIPASEIERRLQVCSSNFYADPGKAPKLGWYQRFLKWYTSNDLTPPPSDATLEISIKQSTPIDSQQDMAGLMKCDYMFSRSKTPFIDPLPGGSQQDVAPSQAAPSRAIRKK